MWLSQQGYLQKVLDKFGMSNAKLVSTPLANHFKLSSEQCPKTDKEVVDMENVPYASVVGCLMYAMVCTRPDLAHVVSQFVNTCLNQVGDIGKQSSGFSGYVDSNYACDFDDRISTIGYVITLATEVVKEALWLIGLVKELDVQQGGV
ncbi:Detected protein of unknown function [Hibiscus syriacus]|uniref:Uncharacterized protein n=1 Tax=Hibiscus syriacus TaxID=106335 RepID=A0A6A3B930_HIBSY|nr:Detected protein of unknown function [Hibiscus syriacus]